MMTVIQKRKKKQKEPPKQDYKIWFTVDFNSDEATPAMLKKSKRLEPYLADVFEVSKDKDIFDVTAKPKSGGFKLDFGVKISTNLNPADYIELFEDLVKSKTIQTAVKNGFILDEDPKVHIWEARYEKL